MEEQKPETNENKLEQTAGSTPERTGLRLIINPTPIQSDPPFDNLPPDDLPPAA